MYKISDYWSILGIIWFSSKKTSKLAVIYDQNESIRIQHSYTTRVLQLWLRKSANVSKIYSWNINLFLWGESIRKKEKKLVQIHTSNYNCNRIGKTTLTSVPCSNILSNSTVKRYFFAKTIKREGKTKQSVYIERIKKKKIEERGEKKSMLPYKNVWTVKTATPYENI